MKNTIKNNMLAMTATVLLSFTSFNANAYDVYMHGQNCMAANVSQGALFSWNQNGVTNNHTGALFLVCPILLDQDILATFTTPRVNVSVAEHMAGSNSSANCIGRIFQAVETGLAESTPQQNILDVGTISNSNSFAPTGDIDLGSTTLDASTGTGVTAHMLCLVQPGSTILTMGARILE